MSYGNKPNEIRHPQAALLAEEYVCQRVQSLGYTADLNSEEVYQLTDVNVVEVVDSDPTVSLSIDLNEFGSINIYNQLAGFLPFPTSASGAVGYGFTEATIDNTNHHDGTISHTDFGEISSDFLVAIKESQSATSQTRALWFNNCFVDSISGTYQVDGFASESVSLTGSQQQWFLNAWAGARVGMCPVITGAAGHLDVTHSTADGSVVILTEDGIKLDSQYWGQAVASGDITAENGYAFSSSSRYRYIWIPNTNTFPSISNDGASPVGGVKEGELEVIIWDSNLDTEPDIGVSGASTNKLLRAQSVDFEIAFDREDLKQLYTGTYYKGLNNTTITATITVLDSDLELWALATGYSAEYQANTLNTLSLADFQAMDKLNLRVDVFNSKDYLQHDASTLLKSITLLDGKVTSVGDTRDVPGRGTQTFDVTFKRAHFTGTGHVGR